MAPEDWKSDSGEDPMETIFPVDTPGNSLKRMFDVDNLPDDR